tara:strand:- start:475 stop:657 length:183 start_codon:yes stop_codon:yes gene_type:complete
MTDFLEINDKEKTIKRLNLEDFSIDNLKEYILELQEEIKRVRDEIDLKLSSINEAENYFK